MTAQVKEVVEDANALDLEQIDPDVAQYLLGETARSHKGVARHFHSLADRQQCGTVDFAMSRQRHAFQENEARGDHVAWQPRFEEVAKVVSLRLVAGSRDDMRD